MSDLFEHLEPGIYELVDDHPSAGAFAAYEERLVTRDEESLADYMQRRDAFRAAWDLLETHLRRVLEAGKAYKGLAFEMSQWALKHQADEAWNQAASDAEGVLRK